ncbi:uncharacterized protein C8A04DRAFT_35019 [Dichotomopilus funicola]|uniref:Uncharacterized protein n=1 Tax=Dichotomopilus funicola TaxID=1934379 RepID=A0AAN6V7M5_9PEZI|nr:hypothetical protein C8A04DRAFT_35019 [Dichotomopilus funicola]
MSGDRPLPPPLEPGTFRAADGTIRRFHASRPTSHDRPPDSASERLYAVIQQFHHDFDRLSEHLFAHSPPTAPAYQPTGNMASGSNRDLRPRFNRDPQPPGTSAVSSTAAAAASPSLPSLRSADPRARNPPSSVFAGSGPRSSRYRPPGRSADRFRVQFGATLDDINRNIHDTDAQLRALMEYTNPPTARPLPESAVSPPLDDRGFEQNPRMKRRKLDTGRAAQSYKGFRYGRFGQLEPGELKMEIVSCDGGVYSDEHSLAYPPENILKNDKSVYCTKSNRCNIVLKHQGGTVFSLQELVIKAPGSKFSCPVREGMVFASMEQDDLFTRTAQYQIQYQPRNHRRGAVYVPGQGDSQTRTGSQPLRAYSYSVHDDDDDNGDEDDDEHEETRSAQIPPEFTTFSHPFHVTTEHSEDEDDDAGRLPHARPPPRRTPNRIGTLPFESDSDDDDNDDDDEEEEHIQIFGGPYRHWPPVNAPLTQTTRVRRRYHHPRPRNPNQSNVDLPSSGRATESNNPTPNYNPNTSGATATSGTGPMTLDQAREASQLATQEAVRAVGGELMAPLAHFFIEKEHNKWIVRFDTPVSGRFLLLKLWSPHPHQSDGTGGQGGGGMAGGGGRGGFTDLTGTAGGQRNIDIQAVVAKGFAGPRLSAVEELA